MENIEKILLVLVGFAITSIIAYLFKMRQLYASVPKLYSHAPLSKNGTLAEIIVYNRGNQAEEDVQVEIDQSIKVELIASSSARVTLENSVVKIDRLHKWTEESAVLLVEEGALSVEKIKSLSSKGVKGRVVSKAKEVPGNYAISFTMLVLFLLTLASMLYGMKNFENISDNWAQFRLSAIYKNGWSGLSKYNGSDVSDNYQGSEFPIAFVKNSVQGSEVVTIYEVLNKTAVVMEVTAMQLPQHRANADARSPYFEKVEVPPLSSRKIEIKVPTAEVNNNNLTVEFSIESDEEFIYGLSHRAKVGP